MYVYLTIKTIESNDSLTVLSFNANFNIENILQTQKIRAGLLREGTILLCAFA